MDCFVNCQCFCEASQKLTTCGHTLCGTSRPTLAARRSFLFPDSGLRQNNITHPLALDVNFRRTQGGQTHQEKPGVKSSAVNPPTQSFGCYLHPARSQQLSQLHGVQAPLSHGILQQVPGEFLPLITQSCRFQVHLQKIFSWAAPNGKRPTRLRVFEIRRARIIPPRVPKLSPHEFLSLYSSPRHLERRRAFEVSWGCVSTLSPSNQMQLKR